MRRKMRLAALLKIAGFERFNTTHAWVEGSGHREEIPNYFYSLDALQRIIKKMSQRYVIQYRLQLARICKQATPEIEPEQALIVHRIEAIIRAYDLWEDI